MSIIANTSVLRVRFICVLGDQVSFNVVHMQPDGPPTGDITTTEAATAISTVMAPLYKAMMTAQATYWGCDVQDILPQFREDPSTSSAGRGLGTVVGETLPRGVTSVVAIKTGIASRTAQGRIYLPFPSETSNDTDGFPTAGHVSAGLALVQRLLDTVLVVSGGNQVRLSLGVYSRKLNLMREATFAIARAGWGYQRRRGFFGAPNEPPW